MQTVTLHIQGMACAGCTNAVMQALQGVPGVESVEVVLSDAQATVRFDPARVQPDQLKSAVEQAGYSVTA